MTDQRNIDTITEAKNVIFQDQDFQKISKASKKLYIAPLTTMGVFSTFYLLFRYGNLSRILPNPLKKPKQQTKIGALFKKRADLLFVNSLIFLGFATFIGAFFAKEINTYQVYARYQRQVAYYMRWKLENEIKKQLVKQIK